MNIRFRRNLRGLVCFTSMLAVACPSLRAATFTVTTADDEFDTPSTSGSGLLSLREAIRDANALAGDDVIGFNAGLDGADIELGTGAGALVVSSNIDINASTLTAGIALSANGLSPSRVFEFENTAVASVSGLSIQNGSAQGATTLDQSGGAVLVGEGCDVTFTGCMFKDNVAVADGGVIRVLSDTSAVPVIGVLTLDQCTLFDNTAGDSGGAVYNEDGLATITNCTFENNVALNAGGAIHSAGALGNTTLNNATLTNNEASAGGSQGGGVFIGAGSSFTLRNSIVANNAAAVGADIRGTITTSDGIHFLRNITGASGLGAFLTGDPGLAKLGDYGGPTLTRPPLSGSPVIDAGGAASVAHPATDQRGTGFARELDGDGDTVADIDIGAVEILRVEVDTLVDDSGGLAETSLREAVDGASHGYTHIGFDGALDGGTITLLTGQILMDEHLDIDATGLASGLSVDGDGLSRVFEVAATAEVGMHGLTVIGGNAAGAVFPDESGGGILNGGMLSLSGVTVSGNMASGGGGGIFNNGGTLIVDKSTVKANSVLQDGAGVAGSGTMTITNSTVHGNTAIGNGGGLFNSGGVLSLTHATVAENQAVTGGGLAGSGTLTLENSVITENTATGSSPDVAGTVTAVSGVNYIGETAGITNPFVLGVQGTHTFTLAVNGDADLQPLGDYGGRTVTMPPKPGSPVVDVTAATVGAFSDQRGAPRPVIGEYDLGAVEYVPIIVINNSDAGGGSLRDALLEEFASTLSFAGALDGALIRLTSGEIALTRSICMDASGLPTGLTLSGDADASWTGNTGDSRIFNIASGHGVELISLTLTHGHTEGIEFPDTAGGCIFNDGSALTLVNCVILNGTAALGGGIYNDGGPMALESPIFLGNSATFSGGGIHSVNATVTLDDALIIDNSADDGGGIYNNAGNFILTSPIVNGNTSTNNGAGIHNTGGSLSISNPDISANASDRNGGGIFNSGGTLTITSGSIYNNSAVSLVGGGIGSLNGPMTIDGVTFTGNGSSSINGGAIYDNNGTVTITNSIFDSNAASNGGSIYAINGTVDIVNCSFTLNSANNGGGILEENGNMTLTGCTLSDNSTTLRGGGLLCVSGNMTLTDSTISGNSAGTNSGGIQNDFGDMDIRNCVINANTASTDGGGISTVGAILTVINSTIYGNTAGSDGGGLHSNTNNAVLADALTTLINCTIAENTSSFGSGGGVFNSVGPLEVQDCTVSENLAGNGLGAGVGSYGDANTNTFIRNSVVAGNSLTDVDFVFDLTNSVTSQDYNLVGTGSAVPSFTQPGDITGVADPRLAPLFVYVGTTPTMPPLPGSPAIEGGDPAALPADTYDVDDDTDVLEALPLDQHWDSRIIATNPDTGSVEAVAFTTLGLPDTDSDGMPDVLEPEYGLTVGVDDSAVDGDGDGDTDADEIANMTDPADSMDFFRIESFTFVEFVGGDPLQPKFSVVWNTFPGFTYNLRTSANVGGVAAGTPLGPYPATQFSMSTDVTFNGEENYLLLSRE